MALIRPPCFLLWHVPVHVQIVCRSVGMSNERGQRCALVLRRGDETWLLHCCCWVLVGLGWGEVHMRLGLEGGWCKGVYRTLVYCWLGNVQWQHGSCCISPLRVLFVCMYNLCLNGGVGVLQNYELGSVGLQLGWANLGALLCFSLEFVVSGYVLMCFCASPVLLRL